MAHPFGTFPRDFERVRRGFLGALALLGLAASILVAAHPAEAAVPVAVDDHYSMLAGATLEPAPPGVFANDTGVSPSLMTIQVQSNPTRGTVTVTGPGLFRYETEELFTGTDAFSYCIVKRAAPAVCITDDATVSIDIGVAAVEDAYSTPVNTPLTVSAPGVLANDVHIVSPMASKFDAAAHGTLVPGSDGGFGYTPLPGFRGTDTFAYCVVASAGVTPCVSNSTTVTVRVGLSGLVVADDHYQVDIGSQLLVPAVTGLLANDQGALPTDPVHLVSGPQHGVMSPISAGGGFSYSPSDAYAGIDSFTYCITAVADVPPCLSGTATAFIQVHPIAVRVGGVDRFAVSAAVSARTFAPGVPVVYLASGTAFPDALSGSAAAGALHGPVLLVTHDVVPETILPELHRLKPAKIVILGGTASIGAGVEDAVRPLAASVVRYGGADRYVVSARVSHETFATGVPVAYVASGENFPDALSGSAAAGHLGGPVLLVIHDSVPSDVSTELARLKPGRIVVLGGSNAIAAGVLDTLADIAPTSRIGGADRFAVSAAVSKNVFPTGARTVYIASGTGFPDALSGSSAAVAHNAPVLLVTATAIPPAVATELGRLDPARIIVLGGTSAVSDAVLTSLKGYLAG